MNAPEWDKTENYRTILYKEKLFRDTSNAFSDSQLKNLENQYTQLKNNLERQGDYLHAGHFHFGEQEIRRKILQREKNSKNKLERLLIWCYRFLSGYGERAGRASTVFLGGLLAASLVLALVSADYSGIAKMGVWQILRTGLVKWFGSGVEIVTPFSWRYTMDGINSSNWFRYAILIFSQIALLGVQLPLLIMAVRRRFKR
ncbi:MAG: hypothetical protein ACE5G9_14130 [Nitrospinales bacterium]